MPLSPVRPTALLALTTAGALLGGPVLTARGVPTPTSTPVIARVGDARCYPVDSRIHVRVSGLRPGTTALASTDDTASTSARVDQAGRAVITLVAPSSTGRRKGFSVRVIEIGGQGADGNDVDATSAFLLARHDVCQRLVRHDAAG